MDKPKNNSSPLIIWIFIWLLLMGLALAGFGYWADGNFESKPPESTEPGSAGTHASEPGNSVTASAGGKPPGIRLAPLADAPGFGTTHIGPYGGYKTCFPRPQKSEAKCATPPDTGRKGSTGSRKSAKGPSIC